MHGRCRFPTPCHANYLFRPSFHVLGSCSALLSDNGMCGTAKEHFSLQDEATGIVPKLPVPCRNSEIYNHVELKERYLKGVHIVKDSKSDSAIIGHMYEMR